MIPGVRTSRGLDRFGTIKCWTCGARYLPQTGHVAGSAECDEIRRERDASIST